MQGKCPFVDRVGELNVLWRAWRERPGLVVVYGRRRVGKTRLLVEWLRRLGARSVYYLAHLASHEYNLACMAERTASQLGDPLLARLRPRSLGDLLELIARYGDVVVVIDEFTYWVRSGARVLSELQEFVDMRLPDTRMLLVVSGSLVGVMERSVLGGGSPLYGRAMARLRLEPLEYPSLKEIVGGLAPADRVRLYALVGGIPFYLCQVRNTQDIKEVVWKLIIEPGAPIRTEKDFLLREELRDPHTYSAILSALARGYDTPARISDATGIDSSHVSKYLHVLEHLGFVRRDTPLFRKRGRYRISDPVLRTWYTLVEPVEELLEVEALEEAFRRILGKLDEYTAPVWEDIVRRHLLAELSRKGYHVSGRLEHKGEELDIAILDTKNKRAVVAEAKWSTLDLEEAERLRREAERKAARLLPKDYTVEKVYVAARSAANNEKPEWLITPEDIENSGKASQP